MINWDEIIDKLDYAFQPIIYAQSGKLYAVEALLRNVQDIPNITTIDDLFDLVFSNDYLYEFDLLLREKAIKKFANINIPNLKLFYNLDNRIIYNKNYSSGNTQKILTKYNLSKDKIIFELSEKGTSIEQNALSTMLQRYKQSGYSIAIDDFGSGYSSLNLLKNLNVDILKIDMSFIRKIGENPKTKSIVHSIIGMAHEIGIKTVAEGVETEEQVSFLRQSGCDYIQGYYYSKPLPEEEFVEFLEKADAE